MKIFAETDRIILREITLEDAPLMFKMDSDPEVHKYLGSNPLKKISESEEIIRFIRQQYEENGIGRWAVIDKESNQFVGWGGIKFITTPINDRNQFYEVGYRFLKEHWGKGYATESAKASLKYAFEKMNLETVYAMAHGENAGSRHVLQKSGLKITGHFDDEGIKCDWFEISREDWLKL
ncbi:GNAT family N-acetyltransferase [Pedobacter gandavensis]|uniref:GNAT family N-acetyltransferase n=1 Tax=Pedobacter gandavensis TaxID=2679963 RepID=A0ABR6EUW7_9SPHI|nr:GNAT family N-acetyltransferase [Pedobacter gandavensis]MBB2149034.1 GNAT family N-acetyltransferase [Pedobacter gandavensis]